MYVFIAAKVSPSFLGSSRKTCSFLLTTSSATSSSLSDSGANLFFETKLGICFLKYFPFELSLTFLLFRTLDFNVSFFSLTKLDIRQS